jgi:hypothetical protein
MGLSEMGEAALAYANRGWAVFPLHTPVEGRCSCRQPECRDIGKHPRTRQGSNDASADLAVVERWWTSWPTANIAIACAPSNLVVIDIDPRHGGDESLRDLVEEHGEEWLDTVSVVTGGGDGDVRRRPARPPSHDHREVRAGVVRALPRARVLADVAAFRLPARTAALDRGVQREHRPSPVRVRQCCFAHLTQSHRWPRAGRAALAPRRVV